jgi:hypothetical protein
MKQITNPYLKSKVVRSTEGHGHHRNNNNKQPQSQPQPNVRDATTTPHARNEISLVKLLTTHDHHKRFPPNNSGRGSVSSSTLSFSSKVTPSIVPVVSSSKVSQHNKHSRGAATTIPSSSCKSSSILLRSKKLKRELTQLKLQQQFRFTQRRIAKERVIQEEIHRSHIEKEQEKENDTTLHTIEHARMQMRSRHDDPSKNKLLIPEYQETIKQQQQQQKHLPLVFSTQPRMATTVHGMHQDNNFLPPQNQWNATDVLLRQNQSSFLSPTFPRQPVLDVKTTQFNHNDSNTRLPCTSHSTDDSTTTNDRKNMPTTIAMVETTSPFMNNPLTNDNQTFRRSDAMVDTNNNNNKPTKSVIEASTSSLSANECRPSTTLTTMAVHYGRNETNSSVSDLNREELSQTTSYVGMKDSESIRDCLANGYSTIIGNKNNIDHNDKCINHSNEIEMSTCSNIESIDGKESCATSCAEVLYITSNVTRDALTSVLSSTV